MKRRNFKIIIRNLNVRKLAYLINAESFNEATKFAIKIMANHGFRAGLSGWQGSQVKIVRFHLPKEPIYIRSNSPVTVVVVNLYHRYDIDNEATK